MTTPQIPDTILELVDILENVGYSDVSVTQIPAYGWQLKVKENPDLKDEQGLPLFWKVADTLGLQWGQKGPDFCHLRQ